MTSADVSRSGLQSTADAFIASAKSLLAEAAGASTSGRLVRNHLYGVEQMCRANMASLAARNLKAAAEEQFSSHPILQRWQDFAAKTSKMPAEALLFVEAELLDYIQSFVQYIERISQIIEEFSRRAWEILKGLEKESCPAIHTLSKDFQTFAAVKILASAKSDLPEILRKYYQGKLEAFQEAAFQALGPTHDFQSSDDEAESECLPASLEDITMESERGDVSISDVLQEDTFQTFHQIAQGLRSLHLEEVSRNAFKMVLRSAVKAMVERYTAGKLTRAVLQKTRSHLSTIMMPLLTLLLPIKSDDDAKDKTYERWKDSLTDYIIKAVGQIRINNLFDITKLYPESSAAVKDLEECVAYSGLQRNLIRVFQQSCASRLHIPGAKTNDIIDIYVNSIRILRQVDPTGVLLEAVSRPTRAYLQQRKDTIRCIVTAMTDVRSDAIGDSLADELQKSNNVEEEGAEEEDDQMALTQASDWVPEPVTTDVENPARAEKMHDIIFMLVQIYGSKDLFLNEYRSMLAERLLAKSGFDADNEIRALEHLKKRFGESNLHTCEVMMKDLADSRRLYNTIKAMPDSVRSPIRGRRPGASRGTGPVSATILSALFWPPLQDDSLQLPDQVEDWLNEYAAKFWVAKQPRKLQWKKQLGVVELTLRVNGISREFTVPPAEAAVIVHFQKRPTRSAKDLALDLGISEEILRRKAAFWVKHGVLLERQSSTGALMFARTNNLSCTEQSSGADDGLMAMDEDGGGTALVSQEDLLSREMAIFEQYIMGMLTTFQAGLPLQHIHNNLKMFVPDHAYDKSSEQLSAFLGRLVSEEKLKVSGNLYSK